MWAQWNLGPWPSASVRELARHFFARNFESRPRVISANFKLRDEASESPSLGSLLLAAREFVGPPLEPRYLAAANTFDPPL